MGRSSTISTRAMLAGAIKEGLGLHTSVDQGRRWRMRGDDFAFARGATCTSYVEAEGRRHDSQLSEKASAASENRSSVNR
jgi:hypothetical protein